MHVSLAALTQWCVFACGHGHRNDLFFIRNHNPVPDIDGDEWELEIDGNPAAGIKGRTFTLKQLKEEFPKHEVVSSLQCAGNRQEDFVSDGRPLYVAPHWRNGAIGNAKWGGVRVRDILRACGMDVDGIVLGHKSLNGMKIVNFIAEDTDETGTPYAGVRSWAGAACHTAVLSWWWLVASPSGFWCAFSCVLCACAAGHPHREGDRPMGRRHPGVRNERRDASPRSWVPGASAGTWHRRLPQPQVGAPDHRVRGGQRAGQWISLGPPLRPGHLFRRAQVRVGVAVAVCAGCLRECSHPACRKHVDPTCDKSTCRVRVDQGPVIQTLPVQSVICVPADRATLSGAQDTVHVKGIAYSGAGRGITRVELSIDGGRTFTAAELLPAPVQSDVPAPEAGMGRNWAWQRFEQVRARVAVAVAVAVVVCTWPYDVAPCRRNLRCRKTSRQSSRPERR